MTPRMPMGAMVMEMSSKMMIKIELKVRWFVPQYAQ